MMGMLDIHRIITTTLKKSCVYRKCLPTWQSWKASYNYTNIQTLRTKKFKDSDIKFKNLRTVI